MQEKMWTYLIHLGTNMWENTHLKAYYPEFHTDEKVWRDTVDFLPQKGFNTLLIDIGDAIMYESHPEISIKGAWSKDKMKKELDYLRSIGLTPLPKLNFSASHDIWMGKYHDMLSTPTYYQVCADLIREICELFDTPSCFHLGLDEERPSFIDNFRTGERWWKDVYFLLNECEKNGVRPWVWADPCWERPEEYLQKMPKSVLQSNWWYNQIKRNDDGSFTDYRVEVYHLLDKAGYDQIPTASTWSYQYNIPETFEFTRNDLADEHVQGVMAAPWQLTTKIDRYTLLDDANRFGFAKAEFYPE